MIDIYLNAPTREALDADLTPLGLVVDGEPKAASDAHALLVFGPIEGVAGVVALVRCLDDALATALRGASFTHGTQIVDRPVTVMAAGDDVVDLAAQAAAKTAEIQAEKCRIRDGGFVVDGVLFDSDQAARTSYLELALRFGVDPAFSTRWKASAGVWVAMDATLFARVQAMGTAHMQAAFAWQEARDAELAAILAQAAAGTMNQAEAVAALRGVPERFS